MSGKSERVRMTPDDFPPPWTPWEVAVMVYALTAAILCAVGGLGLLIDARVGERVTGRAA